MLDDLVGVIELLKEYIATHGASLRENEARTRVALIDPLLRALEWDTNDIRSVAPEYRVGGGGIADYALLNLDGNPLVILEIKKLGESLVKHRRQIAGYAAVSGTPYAVLTDGNHWELYDMFRQSSIEEKQALQVSIADTPPYQCAWLIWTLRRTELESKQLMKVNAPDLVEELRRDMPQLAKDIDPQRILNAVADYYGLELEVLLGRSKKRSVSYPRQVAMFLLVSELRLSPTQVGRLLGEGRNHSTVIHGAGKINTEMNDSIDLRNDVLTIMELAGQGTRTAR